MELEIHLLMCCSHDGLGPCINLNFEPVNRETARMSMSSSLTGTKYVCHLVALTKYFLSILLPAQFHL